MHKFLSSSPEESIDIGRKIGAQFGQGGVLLLEGEMGSGKTVIAKGIAQSCGIAETVLSPTFQIIISYEGAPPLLHIDLYRLSKEAVSYLDIPGLIQSHPNHIILIEWAVHAENILEEMPMARIVIKILEENKRSVWLQA